MKNISILLLLIFGLVQLAPGIISYCGESTPVFITDEEKGGEKPDVENKKEKKEPPTFVSGPQHHNLQNRASFMRPESILPYPCLEQQTPPPNEC